jgi:hypothetical protein
MRRGVGEVGGDSLSWTGNYGLHGLHVNICVFGGVK